jgi:hypothetical protein
VVFQFIGHGLPPRLPVEACLGSASAVCEDVEGDLDLSTNSIFNPYSCNDLSRDFFVISSIFFYLVKHPKNLMQIGLESHRNLADQGQLKTIG